MPGPLFERTVVPVASEEDAEATMDALLPYAREAGGTIIAVHVIEKAGGAPDRASVEQRERHGEAAFEALRAAVGDGAVDVETALRYGTDAGETIVEAAREEDASAIVFTPRGGSRWVKLLTGDVTMTLVEESDHPVVVLPDRGEDAADA